MSLRLCVPLVTMTLFSLLLRETKGSARIFNKSKGLTGVSTFKISENTHRQMSVGSPRFCHKLDCPDFTVVNKTDIYEERLYKKSAWVSTKLEGVDFSDAQSKMFMKLFRYIEGGNAKGEKIAMTAPVITHIIPGPGPACASNFIMSFFMAPKVSDPPQPTDKSVYLSSLPQQTVYVKSFPGRAHEADWLKNAEELAGALSEAGKKFNKDFFYSAGYDSPFTFFDRHNEVWIFSEE